MTVLRPFQRRFVAAVMRPGIKRAALSLARGNGKSWLCGYLVAESIRPGGRLFVPGVENVLLSGSFDQARYVWRFARDLLGEDGYTYTDNKQAMTIQHKPTRTRLTVKSSRARGAFGIVGARLAIADEPGAWDVIGGQMMADALDTSMGKPGSPLTVVYVGTQSPAREGWWIDLVQSGSRGSTHVQSLQGDLKRWDQWPEIRRCNPLTAISPEFGATLREERDNARSDPRLKARFCSYRLNRPCQDESTVLLTVDDWQMTEARPVGDPIGRPIVGLDLGGGRAWSAAVALWRSGRVEAFAVAPGQPSVEDQERRDRVPAGTYRKLHDAGLVITDGSRRVPRVKFVMDRVRAWRPEVLICDRFRYPELLDCNPNYPLVPRRLMPSEWSEDIRALRRMAADGPLSCEVGSRSLVAASLAVSEVKTLDDGNVRLVKRGAQNAARDDVAAALTLAAGALARVPERSRGVYLGVA